MKYEDKDAAVRELFGLKDGEPWFFVRGQDALSPYVLENYASLLDVSRNRGEMAAEVRSHMQEFRLWQKNHRGSIKLPD